MTSAEPHPRPAGRFISFEGGDAVGKSTQIARLRDRLVGRGMAVTLTREPGGTPRAEAIRELLLTGAAARFGTFAEAALFAAARADHVAGLIGPALARGEMVLCDRFVDSSRVYQGVLGQVAPDRLRALERAATGTVRPDVTLVLDVPIDIALARAASRRDRTDAATDRFEGEGAAYQARVQAAFRDLAGSEPERCVLVDASRSAEEVAEAVWRHVAGRLSLPADAP